MLIKNVIDEVRQDCRMTKVELADKAGMSKQNLHSILGRGSDRARVTTVVNLLNSMGYHLRVVPQTERLPTGAYEVTLK